MTEIQKKEIEKKVKQVTKLAYSIIGKHNREFLLKELEITYPTLNKKIKNHSWSVREHLTMIELVSDSKL